MQDLGDLPGGTYESIAQGINDSGQVAGYSFTSTGPRAFIWDSIGGMQDLGDLPGGLNLSSGEAINNLGQVVGFSGSSEGSRAFLWDSDRGMQDLNGLVDSSGDNWILLQATGINSSVQIVGVGTSPSGATRAFLLTSNIPEPKPISLIGVFAIVLAIGIRRR